LLIDPLPSGGGPVLRRDFATVKDDAADIKSKPVDAIADKLKQMSLAENDKSKEPPPVPLGSAAAAGQPASAPSSPSGGKVPGTDVTKLR
jgi:hypothetical protein